MGIKAAVGGMYGEESNGQYPVSRMRTMQSIHSRQYVNPNQLEPSPETTSKVYKKSPAKKMPSQVPGGDSQPMDYSPTKPEQEYMKYMKGSQEPLGGSKRHTKTKSQYAQPSQEPQPGSKSPYKYNLSEKDNPYKGK